MTLNNGMFSKIFSDKHEKCVSVYFINCNDHCPAKQVATDLW